MNEAWREVETVLIDAEAAAAILSPRLAEAGIAVRALGPEAALGPDPGRMAVVTARPATAAACAGALVVGIGEDAAAEALRAAGAAFVVAHAADIAAAGGRIGPRSLAVLPLAEEAAERIASRLAGRRTAFFFDFDGTLAPIVENPADAGLSAGMRAALGELAARAPCAVVSGRDLDDVRGLVAEDALWFAGSHGFDLAGPEGWRDVVEKGRPFLPVLGEAAEALETALAGVAGVRVERKRFSLAVHHRQAGPEGEAAVVEAVGAAVADRPLKASAGKKVWDVKPRTEWHKGYATLALMERLGLGPDAVPVFFGDDTTDEDAFRAIAGRGIGIVVRDGGPDRATAADYALDGVPSVEAFLRWLAPRV